MIGAFYWPSVLWVDHPMLTLLPVLVFGAAVWRFRQTGRPCQTLLVMTMAWLVYAIYEGLMFVLAQQAITLVRIDLIVLAPLMYVITGVGVVSWWRSLKGYDTSELD